MAIEYLSVNPCHGQAAHLSDYIERKTTHHEKDDFLCAGHGNLPTWATSAHDFFATADHAQKQNEKKRMERNGKTKNDLKIKDEIGKHIIVALPKEFSDDELRILAEKTAKKIGENHAYTWGVHINQGSLSNERNPHLHILICDRKIEPDREEPDRDNYFKKSRPCKNGKINGGYRKDTAMTGKDRRAWVELKKKEYQEICNRHIDRHNQRTAENVPKIDFESRKGKGGKHLGQSTIAHAVRINSAVPAIQKELDRRTEKITTETQQNVANFLDKNGGKLGLWDKTKLFFTPTAKKQEKKERFQIENAPASRRGSLRYTVNRMRSDGASIITQKSNGLNSGLKQTAERRGIERDYVYNPTKNTDLNRLNLAQNRIEKYEKQKAAAEEKERRRLESERKAEEEKQLLDLKLGENIEINGEKWYFSIMPEYRREQFRELLKKYENAENPELKKQYGNDFIREGQICHILWKFKPETERISTHQPTEQTAERCSAKKKNRDFER